MQSIFDQASRSGKWTRGRCCAYDLFLFREAEATIIDHIERRMVMAVATSNVVGFSLKVECEFTLTLMFHTHISSYDDFICHSVAFSDD